MAKIVLDAGHGGPDAGGRTLGRLEKQIALDVLTPLWKNLADLGHSCHPTRIDDVFLELGERAAYSNRLGAEIFISLHANASSNVAAAGPWTIHAAPSLKGKKLAQLIQQEIAIVGRGSTTSFYPDDSAWVGGRRLAVLRQTQAVAVLVEMGFMTNPKESQRLSDPSYIDRLAQGIASGVRTFLGG